MYNVCVASVFVAPTSYQIPENANGNKKAKTNRKCGLWWACRVAFKIGPCDKVMHNECMAFWIQNGVQYSKRKDHSPSEEEKKAKAKAQEEEGRKLNEDKKQPGKTKPTRTSRRTTTSKIAHPHPVDENGCSHMDISYWQSYETDYYHNIQNRVAIEGKGNKLLSMTCCECEQALFNQSTLVVPNLEESGEEGGKGEGNWSVFNQSTLVVPNLEKAGEEC